MALVKLDIADFRNLTSIQFEPIPVGFNLIYGYNGSGKTSLLEAIYYLSLGRSFRSSLISRIIRRTANKFYIFAHLLAAHAEQATIPIGIERKQQGDIKIRISGKDVNSIAQLADLTPVQLINSHCCTLIDSGPAFRRKYVDWGVFYLNNDFLRIWREFGQILRQRNAGLRQHRPKKEIEAWSRELVARAIDLDKLRREYIERLMPILNEMLKELLPLGEELVIDYQSGWDDSKNYADILSQSLDRDFQLGHTQFGPHRADLKITLNKVPVKDILSRGQQKLFVCAMILAQGALLSRYASKKPIYLIDDLPAELDSVSRSNLIALLSKQETQIFVTAVERSAIGLSAAPLKMFHVEHGNLKEVKE